MKIFKVSDYILYTILTITFFVVAFFYLPTLFTPEAKMLLSLQTDILLYWTYILCALAFGCAFVFGMLHLVVQFKDDRRNAYIALGVIVFSLVILFIAWLLGSDDTLLYANYQRGDDLRFWLRITDMLLYTIYFLLTTTVLSIVYSYVVKLFRNR